MAVSRVVDGKHLSASGTQHTHTHPYIAREMEKGLLGGVCLHNKIGQHQDAVITHEHSCLDKR